MIDLHSVVSFSHKIEWKELPITQSWYLELTRIGPNFFVIGRLAESKYYNMDAMNERAVCFADEIIAGQLVEIRF
jgi:UDP-galactopyranose mutase